MGRIADVRAVRFLNSLYPRIFTLPPVRDRLLTHQIVVHHFARFAWIYLVSFILLTLSVFPSTIMAMKSLFTWELMGCMVLVFVLPTFRSRILGGLERFVQTFTAIGLICLNAVASFQGFLDIFDRADGSRLSAVPGHTLLDPNGDFPVLWAWSIGLSFLITFLPLLLRRLSVSRLRLAFITLLVACAALTVSVPAALVLSRHNSGDFLAELGPSLVGSLVAGFTISWSLISIAILVRRAPEPSLCGDSPGESSSNEYVKSASAIATTALIIAFFGLNTCWSYTANLDRFIAVREAFAADLVALAIPRSSQLRQTLVNRTRTHKFTGDGFMATDEDAQADYEALKAAPPPVNDITPRPLWLENVSIQSVIDHNNSFLETYPSGTMVAMTVKEVDRPNSWSSFPTLRFPEGLQPNHTLKEAAACAGQLEDTTTYDKIYRACEKTVLDRGVKFPLIDVEFPIQFIILVTFVAICGCIIILSDRIQTVLDLTPSAKVEPWIVLDATTRTGKLLANAWAIGLCTTPWMLIGLAVAITSLRIRVDGSVSDLRSDMLLSASLLVGIAISAWLSVSLLLRLALLRLHQRGLFRQGPPRSSTPTPCEPQAETRTFDIVDVE